MNEKKYLSDVLTFDVLEKELKKNNNKICIISGVGSGKNHFVEVELAGKTNKNIFLVSSRRAKVQEIKKSNDFTEKIILDEIFDQQKYVTTNFGVEDMIRYNVYDKIIDYFDYFIIDECHSLFTDSTFADAPFHVLKFIEYIEKNYPKKKLIFMTGTPEPIMEYLKNNKWGILDLEEKCISIKPKKIKIINKEQIKKIVAEEFKSNRKVLYMTTSVSKISDENDKFIRDYISDESDILKSGIAKCVSQSRANEMSAKDQAAMKIAMESIIECSRIPAETKILLCTSCLKEGVNIHDDDVKVAFCESHLLSDIQQFMGRIRTELDCLYIIGDSKQYTSKMDFDDILLECGYMYYDGIKSFNKYATELEKRYYDKNEDVKLIIDAGWIDKISSYASVKKLESFVDLMEKKFFHVRYNLLTGEFEIYFSRIQEKLRIKKYNKSSDLPEQLRKGKYWTEIISEYCDNKNIEFISEFVGKGKVSKENIKDLLKFLEKVCNADYNVKWIRDPKKTEILKTIYGSLGWPFKKTAQISRINEKFEELGIGYSIETGKKDGVNGILISFKKEYDKKT